MRSFVLSAIIRINIENIERWQSNEGEDSNRTALVGRRVAIESRADGVGSERYNEKVVSF